mgnify:CR=1 FL=1
MIDAKTARRLLKLANTASTAAFRRGQRPFSDDAAAEDKAATRELEAAILALICEEPEPAAAPKPEPKPEAAKFGPDQRKALYILTRGAFAANELASIIQRAFGEPGKTRKKARGALRNIAAEAGDIRRHDHDVWNQVANLQPFYSKAAAKELSGDLLEFTARCIAHVVADALAETEGAEK